MSIDSGISEHPKLFTHGCVLISCREESMHESRGKPWPWKAIPYFFKLYSGGPRVFLWLASGSKIFAYSYKEIFAPCYFKFSLRVVMWYCTHTHYTRMYAHIYTHLSVYGKKTDWISDSPLLSLMFKGFYNSVSTCPQQNSCWNIFPVQPCCKVKPNGNVYHEGTRKGLSKQQPPFRRSALPWHLWGPVQSQVPPKWKWVQGNGLAALFCVSPSPAEDAILAKAFP